MKSKLIKATVAGLMAIAMLTGASGEGCDPPPSQQGKHHTNPEKPIPNPDPKPPKLTGQPPQGIYVTFAVDASKALGRTFITYSFGAGYKHHTLKGVSWRWGTIVPKGTPVTLIAAPFVHGTPGRITIHIYREPGKPAVICGDENGSDDYAVGGAGCAGNA